MIHMEIASESWYAKICPILIVEQNTMNLLGRDILPKLRISIQQTKQPGRHIYHVSGTETRKKNMIMWIFKKKSSHMYRVRQVQKPYSQITFQRKPQTQQTNRRRVPLHLLEKIEQELDKLINDKQKIRLLKCPNDVFISPVLSTVKKNESVKLALNSEKLNKAIHKNKYQLQSIDHLIDAVALHISERKQSPGTLCLSKIDLKYAYSQIRLDDSNPNIAILVSFQVAQQAHIDSLTAFMH